jgi:hypothetical protein
MKRACTILLWRGKMEKIYVLAAQALTNSGPGDIFGIFARNAQVRCLRQKFAQAGLLSIENFSICRYGTQKHFFRASTNARNCDYYP